jgi:flagellar FliJ protein
MYRFKLEALLLHRCHQEEICQKELALSERQLAGERHKLRQQKKEQLDNIQKLQAKQSVGISISKIILAVNYLQRLSKNIEDQKKCVRAASQKVSQKRNELIIIVKKRKTLEKLKEREWQAYQEKTLQNERILMDEAASARHARKI